MTDPAINARPPSAVSNGVGIAGLVGLTAWTLIARHYQMHGPFAAITAIVACGLPMVGWSILVDKVHRNRTTGIDWDSPPKPLSETLDISLAKLSGLWATWAIIAAVYAILRFYWTGNYLFAMNCFMVASPVLFLTSIPYVIWLDRRLRNPKDGCWAFGSWLMGDTSVDRSAIADHGRSWLVKGFFLAFMLSGVPGNFYDIVLRPWPEIDQPVGVANFLIGVMFLIDMAMATVGYVLTMKPLDSHIRSANPYMAGWVAALICYPPFVLMGNGGPLDYHPGTMDWSYWLRNYPMLMWVNAALLVGLTGVYAWATVAFGLRFSNLTHRGILTHGPYGWMRHPAYVSKNLFWWLSTLPFLVSTGSLPDAVRNTAILAVVSGVYFWRARTEEKHLRADADYRAYAAWIDTHGWIARARRALGNKVAAQPIASISAKDAAG